MNYTVDLERAWDKTWAKDARMATDDWVKTNFMNRLVALHERAMRIMLGQWVSEVEPVLLIDQNNQWLGLTAPGHTRPYVLIPEGIRL